MLISYLDVWLGYHMDGRFRILTWISDSASDIGCVNQGIVLVSFVKACERSCVCPWEGVASEEGLPTVHMFCVGVGLPVPLPGPCVVILCSLLSFDTLILSGDECQLDGCIDGTLDRYEGVIDAKPTMFACPVPILSCCCFQYFEFFSMLFITFQSNRVFFSENQQ